MTTEATAIYPGRKTKTPDPPRGPVVTNDRLSHALGRVLGSVSTRRRWQGGLLLLLMMVAGFAELLSVGAIAPLLSALEARGGEPAVRALPVGAAAQAWLASRPLAGLACVFAGLAMAAAVIRVLLTWATQKFVFRLGYDLEVLAYRRSLSRPYSEQVRINSSTTISGIDKVGVVSAVVFLPILAGASSAVIAAFILTALIVIRPLDALIAASGFAFVYVVIGLIFRGRLAQRSRVVAFEQTRRFQTLQEGLGAIRDIILDQSQAAYADRFARIDLALRDAQSSIGAIAAAPRFAIEGAGMVVIAALVVWLSGQSGGIMAALPLLGALALGAQRLLPLLQQMYNSWSQVSASRQTLLDVAELLDQPEVAHERADAVAVSFSDTVRLRDVAFSYDPDEPPILCGMNLEIRRGERVGLIGRTGSGKSTTIDLLLGLLEPDTGEMLVDGLPLDAGARARWRRQVSHVPQSIYLSDASILENIALGAELADIDEVRAKEAARQADLAGFIDGLPRRYHSTVGERGVRLSGGQRQRIGIARALYKRSDVLILDEATSALDGATERSIMEAIDRLERDLTIIMIAHRLATLKRCDYILRLEAGHIAERGSYSHFAERGF